MDGSGMGRREEWLRIGAAVLVVAVLAVLFLRDRSPEEPPQRSTTRSTR